MKQARTLDAKEFRTLLAYVGTRRYAARDRAILCLSFYAGLRAHELASLTVGNVLGADGRICPEFVLLPSQTKGKKARRVFLSDKLRKELAPFLKLRNDNSELKDALFVTQKSNPFTANAMCHLLRHIYSDAGIVGASSHSGRRTFITNLASRGIGVRVIAALAGHSSISTTQRYIDVNDDQQRAVVEQF